MATVPARPDNGFQVWNVKHPAYNARGNAVVLADGVMNGTTGVLTSASATFSAADVGKTICVSGAGTAGAHLATTIASVQSATQVTLTAVSATVVSGARVVYGTDDTLAIQAAITAASAAGGGVVYLPHGTYLVGVIGVGTSVTIPANVRLEGQTRGACILLRAGTGNVPLVVMNGSRSAMRRVTLDGNYWQVTATNFRDLYLQASMVEVAECEFRNWPSTALDVDTSNRSQLVIRHNRFIGDPSAPGGMGSTDVSNAQLINMANATDFLVEGNYLEAGGTSINAADQATYPGPGVGGGIQMQGAARGRVRGNELVLHSRTNDGITHWGCTDIVTANNVVRDPHDDGITYRDLSGVVCQGVTIEGNSLYDCGTGGVFSPSGTGYLNINILNNTIRNSGRTGITFNGAVNSRCSGNIIDTVSGKWGSPGTGIYLGSLAGTATTDSVVSDNLINQTNGTGIDVSSLCARVTVRKNRLSGIGYSDTYYAIHNNAPDCEVDNNTIASGGWSGAQGWAAGTGAHIGTSQAIFCDSSCRRPKVSDNRIFNKCGTAGIYVGSSSIVDAQIVGNYVVGTTVSGGSAGYGIYCLGSRAHIEGNKCLSNDGAGIIANGVSYLTIVGNHVMNNGQSASSGQRYGIRLIGVLHSTISNNTALDDQATATQLVNISEATTSDYNAIVGNNCEVIGAATNTAIGTVGVNTKLAHNIGSATHTA